MDIILLNFGVISLFIKS